MKTKLVNNVAVTYPKDMLLHHMEKYVHETISRNPDKVIVSINLEIDPDDSEFIIASYVEESYVPFDRIRRITGYLVGTMDRFNDAKKEEVEERVKHSMEELQL